MTSRSFNAVSTV